VFFKLKFWSVGPGDAKFVLFSLLNLRAKDQGKLLILEQLFEYSGKFKLII
jgi:hypothetical protein